MTRSDDRKVALWFLAPNLIGFLAFTAGPVLFSLLASFSNWNIKNTEPLAFNGLENYAELIADKKFWIYLVNTAYMMLGLPVAIFGSLWIAILLNRKMRGVVVYRTLLYLPSFTSGVALMILWKSLYNPEFGPINDMIRSVSGFLHLQTDLPQWLISTRNLFGLDAETVSVSGKNFGLGAKDALIYMGIWTAIGGSNMLLYLAGLSNIPPELNEAASMDGANGWNSFRYITWPQLAPTTFFIVIMSIIGGLQGGFEQARVMTAGGPAGTTTTISYFIYTKAFEEFRVGYASAISWVLFIVIAVVTAMNWKFGNRSMNDV